MSLADKEGNDSAELAEGVSEFQRDHIDLIEEMYRECAEEGRVQVEEALVTRGITLVPRIQPKLGTDARREVGHEKGAVIFVGRWDLSLIMVCWP